MKNKKMKAGNNKLRNYFVSFCFLIIAIAIVIFQFNHLIGNALMKNVDIRLNSRYYADSHNEFFQITEKGSQIHKNSKFIADMHSDSLLWPTRNLSESERGFVSLERLRSGNMAIQGFFSVSKTPLTPNIISNANDSIDAIALLNFFESNRSSNIIDRNIMHAQKLDELARIDPNFYVIKYKNEFEDFILRRENYFALHFQDNKQAAPVAGILGIEGLHCLKGEISNLYKLYDAGFRMIGLSHFFDTEIAGSATGISKYGLTNFGKEVVKSMNKLLLIADLAHTSPNTIDDFLLISNLPPIVSHTGVKGTCNNSRNIGDDHLIAIAKKGGIVGIGFWNEAVCGNTPKDVIKAIRYTADLIGVKHVALGSDWDGSVKAIFSSEQVSQITEGLLLELNDDFTRRFSDEDIEDILGLNLRRFLLTYLPSN